VRLVQHEVNMGLAAALRTGLLASVANAADDDVIVTMDADLTHPPRLIPQLVNKLDEDRLDVVIASRFRPGAVMTGVPNYRRWLGYAGCCLFRVAFPTEGVREYTCGCRAYRPAILRRAIDAYGERFISEQGFSCMAEVLLKLRQLRARMGEIPLELRYEYRGAGSKMNVARTAAQTVWLIARRRIRNV
jgi:dolichol-phosphate mannosyltransferase